jgi:hypothetical protein
MKEENIHSNNETFLAKWLEGELSDVDLKALVSETDYNTFIKIRKGINTYEVLESPTETSFEKIKDHISKNKRQDKGKVRSLNSNGWLLSVAASIVLLFGLFFILGDDIVTIETNYGEQKTIALLDGSQVILNSKSTLTSHEYNW